MDLRSSVVPTILLAIVAAGCGAGPVTSTEDAADADVTGAAAQIEQYRAIPQFVPPGPAFDAVSNVRGKTIFEIPITSEVPFITAVEEGMRRAADLVGANLVVYPNQGDPGQWAQGIQQAIAQDADVITLFAQNPELLGPQIEQAEEAGIPVIVVRTTGEEQSCQRDSDGDVYGTTCIPGPFEQAGRLEADWVIADSGGDANVIVVTASDAPSTFSLLNGMMDEFATRCPGCRVRYIDVPIPQWADRVQTEVQSALVADPAIDYIIPIYDSMSQFVRPAVVAAGREGDVKVSTFNGTPFVLELLENGDLVEMDVGENLAWVGFATMDQAFRVIGGEPPVASEHTPLRVFDDSNVNEAGSPPQLDQGYGDAFIEGYKALWGVTE